MNKYKERNKKLFAVCCDLRKNLKHHNILINSLEIGEFLSNPEYNLIKTAKDTLELQEGNNSIVFEVYEVNLSIAEKIDELKGFYFLGYGRNLNEKKAIQTPYGQAFIYMNDHKINNNDIIIKNYDYSDYVTYNN